jgi:hypothetical protein
MTSIRSWEGRADGSARHRRMNYRAQMESAAIGITPTDQFIGRLSLVLTKSMEPSVTSGLSWDGNEASLGIR